MDLKTPPEVAKVCIKYMVSLYKGDYVTLWKDSEATLLPQVEFCLDGFIDVHSPSTFVCLEFIANMIPQCHSQDAVVALIYEDIHRIGDLLEETKEQDGQLSEVVLNRLLSSNEQQGQGEEEEEEEEGVIKDSHTSQHTLAYLFKVCMQTSYSSDISRRIKKRVLEICGLMLVFGFQVCVCFLYVL